MKHGVFGHQGLLTGGILFLLVAGHSLAADKQVVGRDGSFVAYANGVVVDMQTGLEWFAGPDTDTSYYQAAEWVQCLAVAGGNWRMPTAKELNTLLKTPGNLSGITPLLKTRGIHIWPYQDHEDLSLYLFRYMDPYGTRGFAVRSTGADGYRKEAFLPFDSQKK